MEHLSVFLNALLAALMRSAPYLVIGYLIAAVVREYIPRDMLIRYLGRKGTMPLFNAVAIGALLPICSCGTIPLGIGLQKSGAAKGTTLAFMTSSPAISPVTLILGLSLLGPKMVAIYAVMVVFGSFAIGWAGNRLFERQQTSAEPAESAHYTPIDYTVTSSSGVNKFLRACKWAFWDLGAEVSLDILFGLSLAAVIIAFLPIEWISTWLGKQQIWTLLYIIVIGIPVYTCSVPSIPIVQNLLLMGASPGASLAYLIAGPATNFGELNAIRRGMGGKTALYYVTSLVVLALLAGTVADRIVYRNYQYKASMIQDEIIIEQCCVPGIFEGDSVRSSSIAASMAKIPKWYIPFAALLGVILLLGAYRKISIIWVDPCRHCQFWNEVSTTAACAGTCWVRRLHDFFNRRDKQ